MATSGTNYSISQDFDKKWMVYLNSKLRDLKKRLFTVVLASLGDQQSFVKHPESSKG